MKQEIRNTLLNSDIILFGETEDTIDFYKKYHKLLNIKFCMTNYSENVALQSMKEYGLSTILYDDVEFKENDYIVLCDYECYQPIERRLQADGLLEYKNYVSSELADAVLSEKKIAVFMGTAFMGQIVMGLQLQSQITQKYVCIYYAENELLQPYANKIAQYKHIARLSDVYITSICDKNMYDAKVLADEFMLNNSEKIRVSDYTFNGYYPQISGGRDTYSYFLFRERKRLEMNYSTLALAREDANLRQYVYQNISVEEIVKRVSDSDFYTEEQVKEHFKSGLEKLKKSDENADVPLAEFIEKSCKGMAVYRNLDEWHVEAIKYAMKKVAEKLDIILKDVDENTLAEQIEEASGSELPIYPSVLKYLEIENFVNKKYRVVTFNKVRYLSFEEYIRYCAECMYQVKDMNEFLGIERA